MDTLLKKDNAFSEVDEKILKPRSGMLPLILNMFLLVVGIVIFVLSVIEADKLYKASNEISLFNIIAIIISSLYVLIIAPILFTGLKTVKPNEAYVFTLFGQYYGTLQGAGFYFVNPFVTAINPVHKNTALPSGDARWNNRNSTPATDKSYQTGYAPLSKKISLKSMTLSNSEQKINDALGNPIIIGIVVIWCVRDTAKAVFNVDNFEEYLSIQADAALRNVVRLYPYDLADDDNEKTLRGSSQAVADTLRSELQAKVDIAGLEIKEARITHLSYAPEIAAAMLQRQQASAIIDARQMIVEGAVGMVEMALEKLNENQIVHLDEERKAAMVSNLLVVLCGNKDAQPIVNSGSIY